MAVTPEGRVKQKVRKIFTKHLTAHPHLLYTYWPVPAGFGAQSLDVIGCAAGLFFSVETKRPGGKLTDMQNKTARDMRAAGGRVFEIIGDDGLQELDLWLTKVLHAVGKRGSEESGASR